MTEVEQGISELCDKVATLTDAITTKDARIFELEELDKQSQCLLEAERALIGKQDKRILALEARLKEAERVIAPFAEVADIEDSVGRDDPDDDRIQIVQAYGCMLSEMTVEDFRAARTWMEGKK